jgi:predicted phosphodiesterase
MAIIVGDIHGDVAKASAFLAYEPAQEHVALGDYLDSFSESYESQIECLQLLMESNAVLLLGNHECHYLKKPLFQFAGFNYDYLRIFQDLLELNILRFKVAHAVDGWLCTHAGKVDPQVKTIFCLV